MSKSYGNTINLSETPEAIRRLAQQMFTDPKRIKMTDPGHPQTCNVCGYWKVFAPERAATVWEECRTARRGCVQNKQELAEVLVQLTEPYRQARPVLQGGASAASGQERYAKIERVLQEGAAKARAVAQRTIADVKRAVGIAS